MREDIVYRRKLPHGPEVRLRRTSPPGSVPVIVVLDVERRAGTRQHDGVPPSLKQVRGTSEAECVAALQADADDDRAVAALMRAKLQR